MDWKTTLSIMGYWALITMSLSSVVLLYYSFVRIFTNKKYLCWVIVTAMVAISVWIYIESQSPHTVIMKEDVLYVKPISKIN